MAQTSNEESRLEIKREWRGYFVTTPNGSALLSDFRPVPIGIVGVAVGVGTDHKQGFDESEMGRRA